MKALARGLQVLGSTLTVFGILMAGDSRTEVPLKLYDGYTIVVRGSIGGLEKLNFLVDTGAVPSVVDRRIAHKLRLATAKDQLSVFNQNLGTLRVVLPSVELGPIQTESLPVLVEDLSFIEKGLGVRIDAMIGVDVLGLSDFSIDYEAKKISFGRSGDPSESPELALPFQAGPGFVVVSLDSQGQPLRLMVDTGTKSLKLFQNRVRGRLLALQVLGEETTTNMGGGFRIKKVQLPEARLGQRELGNLTAYFIDGPADAGIDFDGLLGIVSLGFTRVAFDFKHQTINLAN